MALIKLFLGLLWLIVLVTFWPVALAIAIFLGLMKVGMKKDFEP